MCVLLLKNLSYLSAKVLVNVVRRYLGIIAMTNLVPISIVTRALIS